MANMFSREIREAAAKEVSDMHKRKIELHQKRQAALDEFHKLDEEYRDLSNAIDEACNIFGIGWQYAGDATENKIFTLSDSEEPSE